MNLNIKATNTKLTSTIKEYIEEKIGSLAIFLRPEEKIRVEIEVDKKRTEKPPFRAEIDIQPHGHYAEARGMDIFSAVDILMPKIKEQLTREKDKRVSLRRRRHGVKG